MTLKRCLFKSVVRHPLPPQNKGKDLEIMLRFVGSQKNKKEI